MPSLKNALKKLCSDANIIKETYYGSSHRASFTLNGEKSEWDIFHIGIPFSPKKEAELMRRFGLERNDLPSFYGYFEKAVVRHINLVKALNESGIPAIRKSIIEYRSVQYYPRVNQEGRQTGQDFYFISRPMEDFVGTDIITQKGAYLQDINNLAVRLLQTAKTMSENGFSLGAIDLDSCFYVPDELGKKFLKLGYCFYGTAIDISPDIYTEDVRPFIPETISNGVEKQGLDSDVRTICAYIWTMLDGKHYTEPNLNAWTVLKFYAAVPQSVPVNMLPRYAPAEISSLLIEGITHGADAMRLLQTEIRQLNKRIAAGEMPNTFIPFEEASYLSKPLPACREDREEAEESEEVLEKKETEAAKRPDKKRKPKIAGIVIATISVLIIGFTAAYLVLGMDGIRNLLHPVRYSMSSASNVYSAKGKVVNDKLQVYTAYTLDENGNIVKIAEPESILFPKEYVSEYIFVENVKLAIVDKHFSSVWTGSDLSRELRENVVDLRNIQDLFYNYAADAVNTLPESAIEKNGIREDSLILMSNDSEDTESFAVVMLVDMADNADLEYVSSEASEDTGGESTAEPGLPVQEVQYLSDTLLYKTQGEWRNKVEVSIEPKNVINSRITLTSEDPDHMFFVVKDDTGKESKTKSIRLSMKDIGEISFFVVGNTEGRYLIRIESEDGSLSKRVQMTFSAPNDYSNESVPPRPTPAPLSTPEPEPTPAPEPEMTPAPTPTPWQDPYTQVYLGGIPGDDNGGRTEPTTIVDPVDTTPEPVTTPAYTPEPVLPLSCSIEQVELSVGDTFRLGDYLDGIEGGYLTAVPSPGGIVSINQADGFLISGLSPGTCVILISKGTESVSVSVTVS